MIANAQIIKVNQVRMVLDRGYDASTDLDYLDGKKVSFKEIKELNAMYVKNDDPDDKLLVYFMMGNKEKGEKEYTELITSSGAIKQNVIIISEKDLENPFVPLPFNMWNIYYVRLLNNPTDHYLVPTHEKLSPDEKSEFFSKTALKEFQLPILYASDPISMWYGFLPGDIIRTIGKHTIIPKTSPSISYRVVKNISLSLK